MENECKLPDLTGKKVLITGGLGFIGSNLAHKCLEYGAEVTIYDNLAPNAGGNIYNIQAIRKSVTVLENDICDFDRISRQVIGKDIIFNCAASISHPFSMKEPWIDLDINGRGVINLLEALRRFNRGAKFVHLGTTTQLGRLEYRPADEKHPEFPIDIYSANKSVSEKYVLIYANAYGMRAAVIRLPNVYGPRASIHSPEFTFNNYFIGLALQNKDITVFGKGNQLRNIIYVDDAVEALILASQNEEINGNTFFATGEEHYSVAQIAEITARCMGEGKVKFVEWPRERKMIDIGDAVISNHKIKGILSWSPRYDIEKGLTETKAYYADCLDKYLDKKT